MVEYIERQALQQDIHLRYCKDCNNHNKVKCKACWVDDMLGEIAEAPTADVVEVVRCKDCKHAYFRYNCKDTMQEIYACEKRPAGRMHKKVGADFFCAHGERK